MFNFKINGVLIIVVDPEKFQNVIGKTGIVDGHNVEIVGIKSHYAIVKEIETGQKFQVVWGKLAKWDEDKEETNEQSV